MINRVILLGRLGRDPEKRSLPEGTVYVRFSLATHESYKDKQGEWKEQTEWHNIVLWGPLAERAEKTLQKGNLIYLEGKLTHRQWTDDQGVSRSLTEVRGSTYRLLEKRPEAALAADTAQPEYLRQEAAAVLEVEPIDPGLEDDLPF